MLTGKIVLIAEDDTAMRFFVAGILKQQLNCEEVIQCINGNEAINELTSSSKNTIDLILCDWEMPGATGDEILLHVRGDEEISHIPFIMTTSRSDKDSLIKVAELGIDDYLIKPFSAADIIERINRVMHHKEAKPVGGGKSAGRRNVKITFPKGFLYEGELQNVSQTECTVLVPLFKHGIQGLYDEASLIFQKDETAIQVKGEISGINLPDEAGKASRKSMVVHFKITMMDDSNRGKLIQMIANLK